MEKTTIILTLDKQANKGGGDRYVEVTKPGQAAALGTVYVQQWFSRHLHGGDQGTPVTHLQFDITAVNLPRT